MTLSNRSHADVQVPSTMAGVLGPVDVTGIPETISPADSRSVAGGSYEIISKLGEGAMGAVSLARDPVLRRTVALKSLLPQVSRDSSVLGRFVGEMQITAQLDHPHIVPVYGFERRDASMSYAMKLVQGKELYQLLEETKALVDAGKPIDAEHSLQTRLEIFVKVCDALAYAHSRGVIHRDVKPSNVMIGGFKEVYVVDWGIARQIGAAGSTQDQTAESIAEDPATLQSNRTRLGATVGTPGYMSPEQAAGKNSELDGRSDEYALGLLLQEIVTLSPAIPGTTIQLALVNALQGKRSPMKGQALEVSRELSAIVDRACQLLPADRYASVAEMAADVRRYMNNEEVLALPDTAPRRMGRWLSAHRMLAMGLLAGTFFLGVAAAGGIWAYNQVALAEQRNREVRLVEVQADSSTRAQQLDARLAGYQESLQRLAGAAGIVLEKGDAQPLEPLTEERFGVGGAALDGLVDSTFYGKRVSFDWLVGARAPGTEAAQTAASFGALQSLGMALPRTMIDSLGDDEQGLSQSAELEALAKVGAPISRIGFTLEDGLSAAYPGMSGLTASADGRSQPLYQRAKHERGVVWGPPAPAAGQTMLLTCATTIHARDGRLLGVVHFEIDAGRAIAAALAASSEQVDVSVLVDKSGKVLAQNAKDGVAKEQDSIADDAVRAAISRGESGYLVTKRGGRDVVVTYQPLASMDWYLVTVADVAKLEAAKPSSTATPTSLATSKASARAPRAPLPPAPQPTLVAPATTTSASATAPPSASVSASASPTAPRPNPVVRPKNPFEPWPIYQPKPPK
jgi:eukaryotic-like serine/threonine-protein kinase